MDHTTVSHLVKADIGNIGHSVGGDRIREFPLHGIPAVAKSHARTLWKNVFPEIRSDIIITGTYQRN